MMNFLTMDYFVALAEERNFTRAAERLHITQQTLSAHIATLEKEVGGALFVRHVPLELTHAGQVFYRYALSFQKDYRSLRQKLADVNQQEAGDLRLGTAPTRERMLLPDILPAFQRVYPHVRFVLVEGSNLSLQQKLLDGDLDLAVAQFSRSVPGLEITPFYQEEIVLVLPRILTGDDVAEPRTRQEWKALLSRLPILLNSDTNIAGRTARRLFSTCRVQPDIKVESDNLDTLLALSAAGVGAAFSPRNLVRQVLSGREQQFQLLSLPNAAYTISFGCRRERDRWSVLDRFMEQARKTVQQGKAWSII
ncbi:MAG: LysR family transcriptional regulator [Succiniclasticum sp.]|jgi:DNA-binding transcriptional LysR family regulator